MMTITTTKVRVDSKKDGYGVMDGATEYVDTEPGKCFHIIVQALLSPDFDGKLRLEISHPRSGIRIGRFLGENYRAPIGERDFVNVKLFLGNKDEKLSHLVQQVENSNNCHICH